MRCPSVAIPEVLFSVLLAWRPADQAGENVCHLPRGQSLGRGRGRPQNVLGSQKEKLKLGQGRSSRPAQVRTASFPPSGPAGRGELATCPRSRSRRSCSSRPASPVWARCSTGSIGFSSRARCACVRARLSFARTPPWSLSRVLGRTPLLRPHEVGRGYGAARHTWRAHSSSGRPPVLARPPLGLRVGFPAIAARAAPPCSRWQAPERQSEIRTGNCRTLATTACNLVSGTWCRVLCAACHPASWPCNRSMFTPLVECAGNRRPGSFPRISGDGQVGLLHAEPGCKSHPRFSRRQGCKGGLVGFRQEALVVVLAFRVVLSALRP